MTKIADIAFKARVLLALLALGAAPLRAAFNDDGWGARAAAMGGAFTAVADDADAVFWNPAAPARLDNSQFNLMHAKPFLGLESVQLGMNSFSYAHPFKAKSSALGFGWTNLNASGLYREDAFALSYSRGIYPLSSGGGEDRPMLYGGLNLAYLRNSFSMDRYTEGDPVFAGGRARTAVTADAGLLGFWNRFSFGFAAQNLTRPDVGFKQADRVPMDLHFGTAYRRGLLFFEDVTLSLELSSRDGETELRGGWENWFFERKAAFRAGWNERALSFGFGYRFTMPSASDVGVDYTYQVPLALADEGAGSHRISVGMRFGAAVVRDQEPRVFALEGEEEPARPRADTSVPNRDKGGRGQLSQAQDEITVLERMIQERRLVPVRFIYGSPRIVTDSLVTLDRVVRVLRKYPTLRMRVVGYPDAKFRGNAKALASQRARAVAGYFTARGIMTGRLTTSEVESSVEGRTVQFVFFE